MADRASRILRLLSVLQTKPQWSGPELAERLGVTVRTVRRDVDELRSIGYPVDAEPGAHGGYRLAPGASLPPLALDDDEAVAVALCLRAGAAGSVRGVGEAALAALTKLEAVLPAGLAGRVAVLAAATGSLGGDDGGVEPDLLVALATAARELLVVELDYRDGQGRPSTRRVEPYRVIQASRRWYLLARDQSHDAWRTFRLDRIRETHTSGHRFRRVDPPPDALAYVARSITTAPYDHEAVVLLHAPLAEVADLVAVTAGIVERVDASTTRLTTGADDLRAVAVHLIRLGFDFTVESPDELDDVIAELGARLVAHHRERS